MSPRQDGSPGPLWAAAEARERRAAGMERTRQAAERAAPSWEAEALQALRAFAASRPEFMTEDARAAIGTPEGVNPKAWGPLMKAAEAQGIVERAGFGIANFSNRSPRVLWRARRSS